MSPSFVFRAHPEVLSVGPYDPGPKTIWFCSDEDSPLLAPRSFRRALRSVIFFFSSHGDGRFPFFPRDHPLSSPQKKISHDNCPLNPLCERDPCKFSKCIQRFLVIRPPNPRLLGPRPRALCAEKLFSSVNSRFFSPGISRFFYLSEEDTQGSLFFHLFAQFLTLRKRPPPASRTF